MDGNREFNQLLRAVLESEIPSEAGEGFGEPAPSTRRRGPRGRRPPATLESALAAVVEAGGTDSLGPAEVTLLEAAAASLDPPPALRATLRAQIGRFPYLHRRLNPLVDGHLRDLSSRATRSPLLVPFLLVVLQHRRLAWIDQQTPVLLREYKRAIALRTVVDHYGLPRREAEARDLNDKIQTLQTAIRQAKDAHEREYTRLIGHAAHFETTYQSFTHARIDELSGLKADWKRKLDDAVLFGHPPPAGEVYLFRCLQDIQRELAEDMAPGSRELDTHQQQSRAVLADRTASREARTAARHYLRQELPQLRAQLRARRTLLARTRKYINRQIPVRRRQRLAAYVDALDHGRFLAQAAEPRDALLRELEPLITADTNRRLFPEDDAARWAIYGVLMPLLHEGIDRVSLELLIDTFLVKYGLVNANRDIGLSKPYAGLTRRKHGESAIDLIVPPEAAAGKPQPPPIRLLLPESFVVPVRLTPGASEPRRCRRRRSSIAPRGVHTHGDVQDIFVKIAYGLIRRQGGDAAADPVAEAMDEDRPDLEERAPSWVCQPTTRRLDAPRILAGLAMNNLTPIHDAKSFNAEREELLEVFADAARERLGMAPDARLFDEEARWRRTAGIMHVIPAKFFGEFVAASQRLLERGCESPVSMVHRLWRFLRRLYRAGAEPTLSAQAVTVRHVFDPAGGGPAVIVDVFYTHLSSVNSRLTAGLEVAGPMPLGQVGLTGNAATPHLHMQIMVREEAPSQDRTLGSIYPHEFFKLAP